MKHVHRVKVYRVISHNRALVGMTDEQWQRVLDVSLTGTFRVTRAVLRPMLARGSEVFVNNASVLGWRAQAGQSHYAVAKPA